MASLLENIRNMISERRSSIRILPKPDPRDNVNISKPGHSIIDMLEQEIDAGSMINLSQLEEFRTLSSDREAQFKVYDDLMQDSEVSAILEIYADEATQYDTEGRIIWAESEDTDVAKFVNNLLKKLHIQDNAWSNIYSLCLYGEVYLQTFNNVSVDKNVKELLTEPLKKVSQIQVQKDKPGTILEEYVEQVANPCPIYDLTQRGKTIGYLELPNDITQEIGQNKYFNSGMFRQADSDLRLLEPTRYVHIYLPSASERFPETIELTTGDTNNPTTLKLRVVRGKSILQDVYKAYQELKLMKDSLLLNRVTRSSIIRMLQVEVGDMPKSQVTQLLKRLKDKIEQKNLMDKNDGNFKSQASPGPIENIIYSTTKDGKGEVKMSNIGGDVNVSSIVDLQPFENSFYGKLRVPKAILGANMEGTGLSNGGSLSELDSVFARTIKRIQNAYIKGIETLINIFIIDKGLQDTHLGKFKIKMTSPSTSEDKKRDEMFAERVDTVANFMDLISQEELTNPETRKEILSYFITNFMNRPEITDMLEDDDSAESANEEDVEAPDYGGGGGGPSFDNDIEIGGNFGGGDFDEGGSEDNFETEETPATETDLDIGANSEDAEFDNY